MKSIIFLNLRLSRRPRTAPPKARWRRRPFRPGRSARRRRAPGPHVPGGGLGKLVRSSSPRGCARGNDLCPRRPPGRVKQFPPRPVSYGGPPPGPRSGPAAGAARAGGAAAPAARCVLEPVREPITHELEIADAEHARSPGGADLPLQSAAQVRLREECRKLALQLRDLVAQRASSRRLVDLRPKSRPGHRCTPGRPGVEAAPTIGDAVVLKAWHQALRQKHGHLDPSNGAEWSRP